MFNHDRMNGAYNSVEDMNSCGSKHPHPALSSRGIPFCKLFLVLLALWSLLLPSAMRTFSKYIYLESKSGD